MIRCRAACIEPAAGRPPAEQLIQSGIAGSGRAGRTFSRAFRRPFCGPFLGGRIVSIRASGRAHASDRTQRRRDDGDLPGVGADALVKLEQIILRLAG